ncbi:hypothetical protein SUGI_0894440 [Cryptomeria japonica]|nr:hypothetical protein SUGI_0894440 [Cryptomeria japonica]
MAFLWHKLLVFLGLVYFELRGTLHQRYTLLNVGFTSEGLSYYSMDYPFRSAHGKYIDPFDQVARSEGTLLGGITLLSPQKDEFLRLDPMVISSKLLARW